MIGELDWVWIGTGAASNDQGGGFRSLKESGVERGVRIERVGLLRYGEVAYLRFRFVLGELRMQIRVCG